MKVIVCFEDTRITVPCGDGNLLVKDLVVEAVSRYKRATGKGSKVKIRVHNVKTVSDGGILDFNDQVAEVVDDREQIMAVFEEDSDELDSHLASDGMSAGSSSTENWRPDSENSEKHIQPHSDVIAAHGHNQKLAVLSQNQRWMLEKSGLMPEDDHNGIEVKEDDIGVKPGLALLVRRGSESALDAVKELEHNHEEDRQQPLKRWSTAAAVSGNDSETDRKGLSLNLPQRTLQAIPGSVQDLSPPDSGHSSFRSDAREVRRTPELGNESRGEEEFMVSLVPRPGEPVGLHLIPEHDTIGLRIQAIDPGSVAEGTGVLNIGDRIVDVNGRRIDDLEFSRAQDVLRSAVISVAQGSAVNIRVASSTPGKHSHQLQQQLSSSSSPSSNNKRAPPPLPPKPKLPYDLEQMLLQRVNYENAGDVESGANQEYNMDGFHNFGSMRQTGRRLTIDLLKGSEGLGFTVTTRDNPAGGVCPIYVKSILSKGAAYKDGRLKTGDRLLEVNGADLTGKSQDEVVNMLRSIPYNTEVVIVVGRPETISPILPRVLSGTNPAPLQSESEEEAQAKNKELLTFDIPLHDTGSAGLGVRVKGKTGFSDDGVPRDEGIFVMNVINGGAASKDGRIQPEDQLLSVNGTSLLGQSNHEAMETLRKAMVAHGTSAPTMNITVAREKVFPTEPKHFKIVNKDPEELNHIINVQNRNRRTEEVGDTENIPPKPPRLHSTNSVTLSGGKTEAVVIEGDDAFSETAPRNSSSGLIEFHEDTKDGLVVPFDREGFARQSMSEKRRGHIDPRYLKTYMDSKAAMAQSKAQSTAKSHTPSPNNPPTTDASNLRRANSLESVVKGPTSSTPNESATGTGRRIKGSASRSRACNESFRVAVDRSYDADRDEERGKDSPASTTKDEASDILDTSIGSSHESPKKQGTDKKKSGFLRGLLSRRSANKKGEDDASPTRSPGGIPKSQTISSMSVSKTSAEPNDPSLKARQAALEEQQRIQVHYERFKNQMQQQKERQQFQPHLTAERPLPHPGEQRPVIVHMPNNAGHGRMPIAHNGYGNSDPYGHYMNYDEIQRALKRKPEFVPPQRQRPVSNYFEYGPPPLPAPLPASALTKQQPRQNNQNDIYGQIMRPVFPSRTVFPVTGRSPANQENIYSVVNRRSASGTRIVHPAAAAAMMGSQV